MLVKTQINWLHADKDFKVNSDQDILGLRMHRPFAEGLRAITLCKTEQLLDTQSLHPQNPEDKLDRITPCVHRTSHANWGRAGQDIKPEELTV